LIFAFSGALGIVFPLKNSRHSSRLRLWVRSAIWLVGIYILTIVVLVVSSLLTIAFALKLFGAF